MVEFAALSKMVIEVAVFAAPVALMTGLSLLIAVAVLPRANRPPLHRVLAFFGAALGAGLLGGLVLCAAYHALHSLYTWDSLLAVSRDYIQARGFCTNGICTRNA